MKWKFAKRQRHHRRHILRGIPDRLPLSDMCPGQSGVVIELNGGHSLVSRMLSLGFSPGAEVTIIQNSGHGPLIVCVRDTRVALGRGEAGKIYLEGKLI